MKNISTIIASIILAVLFLFNNSYSQYAVNYAGNFNGTNSYIAVPNTAELNPTVAITLEAWVNPSVISPLGMAVIGKNFNSSYFLAIHPTGRVEFCPKGGGIFPSRVGSIIPAGVWTHIAGTYDGSITKIYINGILDTSTTVITGLIGVNSDSLYIGADRVGSTPALFFNGEIDNVRIWAVAKYPGLIFDQRFQPLELQAPTGYYEYLRASFQLDNDAASQSGSGTKLGVARNLTYTDYKNKAVNYMDYNGSLVLNGITDYYTIVNHFSFNATTSITLEAWIRRDISGAQPTIQNIINKSGPPDIANYALWLNSSNGSIGFSINSPGGPAPLISAPLIVDAQWHHIAATYNSATGNAILYLNGQYVTSANFASRPAIQSQGHNLFVGGIGIPSQAANKFKGQIDGVRIWKYDRTVGEINYFMHYSLYNDLQLAHIEFDKFTNKLFYDFNSVFATSLFAGLAHVSSSHLNNNNELTSPILLSNQSGGIIGNFVKNSKSFFVPDFNQAGITDSFEVSGNAIITTLKAYVLLSHTFVSDMNVTLISPSGTSVNLINNRGAYGNDIMTIFSDDADSVAALSVNLNGPGITAPFSPGIKPEQPLSAFNGENINGWWKMKFVDNGELDRGYLHSWGISIDGYNIKTINLTTLIQGFYNSTTNKTVKDTVRVFLRRANSPYNVLDSSKGVIDSLGKNNFVFHDRPPNDSFYIVVKHRNSIETWSSGILRFSSQSINYDFTSDAAKAFGSNLIRVDSQPDEFAIYNGDVNQDGSVDLTDGSLIDNDAFNFVSGYVSTDVNGDGFVDLSDYTIADNNAFNFVSVMKP